MAKKKSKPAKKAPRSRAKPDPEAQALEGLMREVIDGLLVGRGAPETPLERAQVTLEKAFEETSPAKRARIAKKALTISPDCADAYLLLAEQADSRKDALSLYEKAVEAGQRALGPEIFAEEVGHFWGLLETRPYMRAREALAHLLWTLGRRDEAADHLLEMLKLNPGDNQGVRYNLASWLLDLDRDAELERLLKQYDEESATWAYTRTLLAFRRHGDSAEAKKRLKAAIKANRYVPAYLTGDDPLPVEQPPYYTPGEESEAVIYAAGGLSAWRSTSGAITWLQKAAKGPSKARKKTREPRAEGPTAATKKKLLKLDRDLDVWQADCRPLGSLVAMEGEMVQPWMVLVSSPESGLILAQALLMEPASAATLWDVLAQAMSDPSSGAPLRPARIEYRGGPVWNELTPHLEEIGIECAEADELPQIDALVAHLTEHLTRDEPPGVLDMPGVTPEQVASFYRAAAAFYRRAPWKKMGFEQAIRIQSENYESGPWYAVVMGQSGMTLGVALYEDLKLLKKLWSGTLSDEQNARQTVALTVTYDPETLMPSADLLAFREHRWEVAGPEAYPVVFRKEKGLVMRPPLSWELELLEGCLRAIPELVAKYDPGDTRPHRMVVPVAAGELPIVLSWVEGD